MTQSRYIVASVLRYFGVRRTSKRMTDAAFEMNLMQEGEEILGAYCWRKIEQIEELSMEYWNLRRIEQEEVSLRSQVRKAEETLADAQKQRASYLDRSKGIGENFPDQRSRLLDSIEKINSDRDDLIAQAIQTKKKHSALKMKVKTLQEGGLYDETEIQNARNELASLRAKFTSDKTKLDSLNEKSSALETRLNGGQSKIDMEVDGSKREPTEAFTRISKANRDITKYKAELGLLQGEQGVLFREVGRFLNVNSTRKDCRDACKGHRGIQKQTNLLFQSIELNRKLLERLGG